MATQTPRSSKPRREAPVARARRCGVTPSAGCPKNRLALVGLFLVSSCFALVAIFGPWLAPYPYQQQDVAATAPVQRADPATDGRPHPRHRPARP